MNSYTYDYSRTLMMKIDIGLPDNKGGCKLFNSFEQALEKIKIADALTLGAPKIIYLVGWQYNGHDDKYPAFFEVNEAAKREQDKTALDSLLWLIKEAKKYHTVISFHINLSDAYPDSPLWETYLENNLILLNAFGRPKKTGVWNGRTAYQVRFAEEYKSGFFQKRVDKLFELLPIKELGTVHVDAFFVRKGRSTTISEEKKYRRKMIEYFRAKGVDVTSEFIYRERRNGLRLHFGKSDVIGLIPAFWNLAMSQGDYLKYPPQLLAGGKLNHNIQTDHDLEYLFYGNTTGESEFDASENWENEFLKSFALGAVPYFFLNQHKAERVTGRGKKRKAYFSDNVRTEIEGKKIFKNEACLKEDETLCIPIAWREGSWFAYSSVKNVKTFELPFSDVEIFRITPQGVELFEKRKLENGKITLEFSAGAAYEIRPLNQQKN